MNTKISIRAAKSRMEKLTLQWTGCEIKVCKSRGKKIKPFFVVRKLDRAIVHPMLSEREIFKYAAGKDLLNPFGLNKRKFKIQREKFLKWQKVLAVHKDLLAAIRLKEKQRKDAFSLRLRLV